VKNYYLLDYIVNDQVFLTTDLKNIFLKMFNEFLYIPSPYLFHVYSNPHKFMNILLSICDVLIGHSQLFFFSYLSL